MSTSKLRKINETLDNLARTKELSDIIVKTNFELDSVLSDNNFFVDDNSFNELEKVHNRIEAGPDNLGEESRDKINDLKADDLALPAGAGSAARRAEIGRDISNLLQVTGGTRAVPNTGSARLVSRRDEYNQLHTYSNYFNRINPIPEQTIALGGVGNVALNPIFIPGVAVQCDYYLCDKDGKRLTQRGGNYIAQLPMEGGGNQEVEISGIEIRGAPDYDLDVANLRFNPPNVDFTQPLRFSIDGVYNNVGGTGINVANNKKIDINVNNGVPVDTPVLREDSFDNINNAGVGNNIRNAMYTEYGNHRDKIIKEDLLNIISSGNPDFKNLSDDQKDILWKEIKHIKIGMHSLSDELLGGVNRKPIQNDGTRNPAYADNLRDDFRTYISHERNWPDNLIRSNDIFESYLINNMSQLTQEFFRHNIETYLNNNPDVLREIKTTYTRIKNEIEAGPIDTYVDQFVDGDITDNINRRRFRRDLNYLRFFAGKQQNISSKSVALVLDGKEKKNNYSLNTRIDSAKKISADIDLGDQNIPLSAKSPASLVKNILNCNLIDQGKVRCHIAYNVIKSLIGLANDSHISLTYYKKTKEVTSQIVQKENKIVLQKIDDSGARRDIDVLFDEKLFDATKNHEDGGVRSLRIGLEKLTEEFDKAMNQTHRQYRDATERRLLGLRKGNTRTKLPTSFFLSPLRYISNWGKNMNCDFEEKTVTVGDKSATISFQKGKFTLNTEGLKKPITSRSLGKLLNKRKNKRRVFDGLEREICETVYKQLIENLRKNPKVKRKNFGVKDRMTNRIYVIDETGKWGYIPPEQNRTGRRRRFSSGRIRDKKMVPMIGMKEKEKQEMYKNPILMGRLIKAMAKGML